jgi:hypothetical protein
VLTFFKSVHHTFCIKIGEEFGINRPTITQDMKRITD